MESKKLDGRISSILKEEVDSIIPQEEFTSDDLKSIVALSSDVEDEDGETTDILYDPENKEMIEFKMKGEEMPSLKFIPLAEFKPDVYGLSDDVFDTIEQSNNSYKPADLDKDQGFGPSEEEIEEPFEPEYEEKKGFEAGKKFADTEDGEEEEEDESEVTEKDFKDVDDETLLEFVYSKGMSFTTRKNAINKLFEFHKVTKAELETLKGATKKQKINEVVEDFIHPSEDSFLKQFPSILDYRYTEEPVTISDESQEYELLNSLGEQDWTLYQDLMAEAGITVEYDSTSDVYKVKPSDTEEEIEEGELYEIEEEDKQIIENIVKLTKFRLKEVRGLNKLTNKPHIMEIIVESKGYESRVTYNDLKSARPWSIESKEFNTLQQALDSVYVVPTKTLLQERNKIALDRIKSRNLKEDVNTLFSKEELSERKAKKLISNWENVDIFKEGKNYDERPSAEFSLLVENTQGIAVVSIKRGGTMGTKVGMWKTQVLKENNLKLEENYYPNNFTPDNIINKLASQYDRVTVIGDEDELQTVISKIK